MKVLKLNLKKVMRSRHILTNDLAKKVGVSITTVYFWKSGKRTPTLFNLEVLMNVLDCTPGELLILEEK